MTNLINPELRKIFHKNFWIDEVLDNIRVTEEEKVKINEKLKETINEIRRIRCELFCCHEKIRTLRRLESEMDEIMKADCFDYDW